MVVGRHVSYYERCFTFDTNLIGSFMTSVYTVFDMNKNQVGFAQLR